MAKFTDLLTGNVLDTSNAFTIGQFRNHPDRYSEVTEESAKVEAPVDGTPTRKAGRPKKSV